MGGYGALRVAMKHADVFGSLYVMSPCCLSARDPGPVNADNEKELDQPAAIPGFALQEQRTATGCDQQVGG